MIEAFTYRMDAHTTSDDPTRYRLADETEAWKLLDPIERVRVHLARTARPIRRSSTASRPRPTHWPRGSGRSLHRHADAAGPERMFDHVYSAPHAQLDRQRAEHLAYEASFADECTTGPPRQPPGATGERAWQRTGDPGQGAEHGPAGGDGGRPQGARDGRGRRQARRRLPGHRRAAEGLRRAPGAGHPAGRVRDHRHRVGLAMRGYRPVIEIQFDGFVFPGFDQIISPGGQGRPTGRRGLVDADGHPHPVRRRHRRGGAPRRVARVVLLPHRRAAGGGLLERRRTPTG